jgi:DNA mismatch endonuclease, patch repair protein
MKNKKYKLSVLTRTRMSLARLGSKNPMYGKPRTFKTKLKLKQAANKYYKTHYSPRRGIKLGQQTKSKLSTAMKQYHKTHNNPFKGKHHTKSAKRKIQLARLNRVYPFRDSSTEIKLQKELKIQNIKFTKHAPLLGQPDIFIKPNICIFVDGNFWHANPKMYNASTKIFKGVLAKDIWNKDKRITNKLRTRGYIVLRFWEYDINNNINKIINKINRRIKLCN